MMGGWAGWIKIHGLLLIFLFKLNLVSSSDCWEGCFVEAQRGLENAEYEQIIGLLQSFKIAMATDARSGTGASNGTAILLDTTLPTGTDRTDEDNIISIQKRIGQILAISLPMLTGYNPGYLIKFDETSAWSCENWNCLGRCDMFDVLESETADFTSFASDVKVNDDMLDESCELASVVAANAACSGSTNNMFAVGIVNSNFKTADSEPMNIFDDSLLSNGLDILSDFNPEEYNFKEARTDEFNFYCDKHFPKKAIVGTYSAAMSSLAHFPSASTFDWPGYSQISFSSSMKKASDRIANCMQSLCCSNRPSYDSLKQEKSCTRFSLGQISNYKVPS